MGDAVRDHIRKILETLAADKAADAKEIAQLEAAGRRIVDGGQITSYDEDNECGWEITDWRTGEVLASGHSTYEEYIAAYELVDPDGKFYHHDHIGETPTTVPDTDGVPPSLAQALEDWIGQNATPSSEVAEVAAWPVERVEECRG